MKKFLFLVLVNTFLVINCFSQYSSLDSFQDLAKNSTSNDKPLVLVELFTSESCAACPSAEEMLSRFEIEQPFEKAKLITLEFHVDYKDGFGRKDVYASSLFTQRQRVYDRKFRTGQIYTPQMVVDGDIEFIGSKLEKAEKAVSKTIKVSKAFVRLSLNNNRLEVKISNLPRHENSSVYLAIAEDGIITRNRKGENSSNSSIVRRLNGFGRILPDQNSFEMDTNFQIQDGWKKENIKLVVFVQENSSRKILGVGKISLTATNEYRKL